MSRQSWPHARLWRSKSAAVTLDNAVGQDSTKWLIVIEAPRYNTNILPRQTNHARWEVHNRVFGEMLAAKSV